MPRHYSGKEALMDLFIDRYVCLSPEGVRPGMADVMTGDDLLCALYKTLKCGYPKFYKMDGMCRLGFIAAELLLGSPRPDAEKDSETAVVVFSQMGSYANDMRYQETIANYADFYPSPAIFVYTLPNIVTGEIAIRHGITGETSAYIVSPDSFEEAYELVCQTFTDKSVKRVLAMWCDYRSASAFRCVAAVISTTPDKTRFDIETIKNICDE